MPEHTAPAVRTRRRSHAARRRRTALAGPVAAGALALTLAAPAVAAAAPADGGPDEGRGDGVRLTVSETDGLTPGQSVTVEAEGLDPDAGYYVATCIDGSEGPAGPACAGDPATPGSQLWVSDDPGSDGSTTELTADGTFEDTLDVLDAGEAMDGTPVDCHSEECAVTLFYDHRNGFGTQAAEPVSFAADSGETAAGESDSGSDAALWWGVGGGIGAAAAIAAVAGFAVMRSRKN